MVRVPSLCTRILVVEDDPELLEVLAEILESEGVIVAIARGGIEALERLAAGFYPSAVITDLMMPAGSGEELLEDLRRQPWAAGLPVVAISASQLMLRRVETRATALLEKPFSIAALLDVLRRVCAPAHAA